jgi:nucleoid-associated protein YgaU
MSDKAGRVFAALCVLSVVWIGVYWWVPRAPGIRFATASERDFNTDPLALASVGQSPAPTEPAPKPVIRPADPPLNPPAPKPAPAAKPLVTKYTVVAGDTFRTISERFYKTPKHATAISKANPFVSRLTPGKVILIPTDPNDVQAVPPSMLAPTPTAAQAPAPTPTKAAPAPEASEYVVQPGDTLSRIATRQLGDAAKAKVIFEANRDRLKSENSLKVGQKLRLPAPTKH